jgi:peptidoglycan-N-acetylglucosamine deacetylase
MVALKIPTRAGDMSNKRDIIITTSWDDGSLSDMRLAGLLIKYHIPATFYLPIDNVDRRCLGRAEISALGGNFDIGCHTYHHTDLTAISNGEAQKEIMEGKQELEQIIGREVSSFCYPFGRYNDRIVKIVKACGFTGARTVRLHTRFITNPYKAGTMVTTKQYQYFFKRYLLHTVAAKDYGMLGFIFTKGLYLKAWDRVAVESLNFVMNNGGIWHLWGHSWQIEADSYWDKLERLFRLIDDLPREALKVNNSQLFLMHKERRR